MEIHYINHYMFDIMYFSCSLFSVLSVQVNALLGLFGFAF